MKRNPNLWFAPLMIVFYLVLYLGEWATADSTLDLVFCALYVVFIAMMLYFWFTAMRQARHRRILAAYETMAQQIRPAQGAGRVRIEL